MLSRFRQRHEGWCDHCCFWDRDCRKASLERTRAQPASIDERPDQGYGQKHRRRHRQKSKLTSAKMWISQGFARSLSDDPSQEGTRRCGEVNSDHCAPARTFCVCTDGAIFVAVCHRMIHRVLNRCERHRVLTARHLAATPVGGWLSATHSPFFAPRTPATQNQPNTVESTRTILPRPLSVL